MPVVTNPSPVSMTILDDFLGDSFYRPYLALSGSDLEFDATDQIISGTITDSALTFVFDEAAASASVGFAVDAPDLSPYEASGQSWLIPEDTDAGALVFSYILAYGFLANGHNGAGQPEVSVLGGSDIARSFGREDNVVYVEGEDVSLMLHGGDDRVQAQEGAGAMHLRLGTGNDTATGSLGEDMIIGGAGDDNIQGGAGNDRLIGNTGRDVVAGGEGNDRINGGQGADVLFGNAGNDSVVGGSGRDVLVAGEGDAGRDYLTGGQGADAFVFVTDPYGAQSGRTIIRDFNMDEDMLWTGPSNNGTWDAATAYDTFISGAVQRINRVVYTEDDYSVVILNMVLDDLSADNFVDGPSGGYYAWADLG